MEASHPLFCHWLFRDITAKRVPLYRKKLKMREIKKPKGQNIIKRNLFNNDRSFQWASTDVKYRME